MDGTYIFCYWVEHDFRGRSGGEEGGWNGQPASHPPFRGAKHKKLKKLVNIVADIKGNCLDRYLVVICTLWLSEGGG